MPAATAIIDGPPGDVWTNDTSKPMYQLHVSANNTCGLCWQYAEKISRFWAIPLHRNCRCRQSAIKPGQQARNPFVNYRELVRDLSPTQQTAVMGRSAFRLWEAGVVKWEDVVTPARVRPLHEVVGNRGLSIKRMIKAGVQPWVARRAYETVHTPEHEAVAAQRRRLLEQIAGAGMSQDAVVRQLAKAIFPRITIASGPETIARKSEQSPARTPSSAWTREQYETELKKMVEARGAPQKARVAMNQRPQLPSSPPLKTSDSVDPLDGLDLSDAVNALLGRHKDR